MKAAARQREGHGSGVVRLALAGDVMLGRGIDQILRQPVDPRLFEPHVDSALTYLRLAERKHGPIPRPVDPAYVWGEAGALLTSSRLDARIVNLETAITTSDDAAAKGINYRMHPANIETLAAARIDCCSLANNHVLDWGEAGLIETLATLEGAGIARAGAGRSRAEAEAPAVLETKGGGRILVVALGVPTSGIPQSWAAPSDRPGIAFLPDLDPSRAEEIGARLRAVRRDGDIAVASIHWGGNWGYEIPAAQRRFAHALIDEAGIDIVHGHSSHHAKGLEVHAGRLILYGAGDFINDYEGIEGQELFRDDLALLHMPTLEAGGGRLESLEIAAFRLRRFRLEAATPGDRAFLERVLDRESRPLGSRIAATSETRLGLVR